MASGDVYRFMWVFQNDNTSELNTCRIHTREGVTGHPAELIAEAMVDWWDSGADAVKQFFPSSISLVRVASRRISPLEPVEQEYTVGLPIAGSVVGDSLPGQDAIVVSLRTAKIGRSYRGRFYLPSVAESSQTNGIIPEATAASIADQTQALVDQIANPVTINEDVVVWSSKLSEANDVTSLKVDRRVRVQRRRENETSVYVSPT